MRKEAIHKLKEKKKEKARSIYKILQGAEHRKQRLNNKNTGLTSSSHYFIFKRFDCRMSAIQNSFAFLVMVALDQIKRQCGNFFFFQDHSFTTPKPFDYQLCVCACELLFLLQWRLSSYTLAFLITTVHIPLKKTVTQALVS